MSADILRAAYDYIVATPPFNGWNLPDSEELIFKVARDPHTYGWHSPRGRGKKRRHLIAISSNCVGHTAGLMATMAHEVLHMHQSLTKQETGSTQHNAAFRRDAELICAIHGFDLKAF